tara:strand:+ start:24 stop:158 length:135 start_codon:yes stop_codon:yes gene_type:complete
MGCQGNEWQAEQEMPILINYRVRLPVLTLKSEVLFAKKRGLSRI